ncbi:unnamed protein product [Paramecium primaurelia]|uniref:Transmembrane protein n=1 Tax=Paramecium primaurelia TaxID=5886 RepID=A0A8S1KRC8_PARPR|nr:unnamed protein product [Paramecium primaurelia]
MFLLLLILQLVSSYFINKDEFKIFDHSLSQAADHDLFNGTYREYLAGQIEDGDQIIAVASLSQTFNHTIHVAILSLNKQQTYTVYSLFYDKMQLKLFTINRQKPKYINSCNQIAFDQSQYVLACGQHYQFQNGTLLTLNQLELQNTIYFQSHQNGFITITQYNIFYFDFNFQLIRQQQHKAQAFLVTDQYLYLAELQNIIILNINDQEDIETISLECNQIIKTFAVFQDYLFAQCEKLKQIDQTGKIIEFNQIHSSFLTQTRKFMIIDNNIAFNIKYHSQIYSSSNKIYTINFDDHLITFKNNNIYVIQLLDLSVISAKNTTDNFQIGELEFIVLDYGLKVLKPFQTTNNQLQKPQTNKFYYNEYVIGNDLLVSGDGIDSGFFEKILNTQQLNTDNLIAVIKYQLEKIVFFFLEDQTIYADICQFNEMNIEYYCIDSYIFTRVKSPIFNFQTIYDQLTDQFVVAYCTEDTPGLNIFIDDNLYIEKDDLIKYFLGQEFLILVKKQNKQWIEIFRLQFEIYDLEAKLFINENIIQIAFGNDELYILDDNNQVSIIVESIYGWQLVFIQKFTQQIQSINYSNNQLIIIAEQEIFIYSQHQFRGIVQYNLPQPKLFYSTDKYLYITNSTHLIQFNFNQNQALSNSILRIIQQPLSQKLFIIDYPQMDLLFFNNKVIGLQDQKYFTISTYSQREQYFNLLTKKLQFSNSFNESIQIEITIVGTQLALRVIPYTQENLLKPLNRINIQDIFDGPISNIYIKETDQASFKQIISKSKIMNPQITQNKIIDLIYLQQEETLLFHSQLLQHCILNKECKTLKLVEDQKCNSLDQSQQYAFLICQNYLLYFNKQSPQDIKKLITNFTKIQKLSFDQNQIAIYGQNNSTNNIAIYENFKLIYFKQSNDLQDILIVNKTLYQLRKIELIIIDSNLNSVSIKLLEEFCKYNDSKLFIDTEFRQIKYLSNNSYLITTNNGPTFQIEITFDYKIQIIKRYTSIPEYFPIELTQINDQIFSIVFSNYKQTYAVFYQIQMQNLIPYFQSIQLGKKISKNYIRKSQENRLAIRDILNKTQLIEYDINHYAQIISKMKTEESLRLTFIAENFNLQSINEIIQLQIEIIGEEEIDIKEQFNFIEIFGYLLLGLVLLLILLLVARQIRRYCLFRDLNLKEKKRFDEEKIEYN